MCQAMTNLDSILKSRDITLLAKVHIVKTMALIGFSNSHVRMWELDHKESWALKNWYFPTVLLEKTLESSLDCKEIKPVNSIGNQSWIYIGRTDAEAGAPILWPPDAKSWLLGKDPDTRKDWRQKEKRDSRGWDGWMASPSHWKDWCWSWSSNTLATWCEELTSWKRPWY